jgi:hypothetical protein
MNKALELISKLQHRQHGTTKMLMCVETNEILSAVEWARLFSEHRGISKKSAYATLLAMAKANKPYLGLHFIEVVEETSGAQEIPAAVMQAPKTEAVPQYFNYATPGIRYVPKKTA